MSTEARKLGAGGGYRAMVVEFNRSGKLGVFVGWICDAHLRQSITQGIAR
jgi:hypothetical protein